MNRLNGWKKAFCIASIVGITGLAAYGLYNTAYAYNDLKHSQSASDNISDASDSSINSPVTGGSFCTAASCAACSGCVSLQYEQSVTAIMDTTGQVAPAE